MRCLQVQDEVLHQAKVCSPVEMMSLQMQLQSTTVELCRRGELSLQFGTPKDVTDG